MPAPTTQPPSLSPPPPSADSRLKSALWYSVGQTLDALSVGASAATHDINATPHFIGALAELCYAQLETVARDVESFARHDGGRQVVRVKDVLLLGRRNEGLSEILEEEGRRIVREEMRGKR
nr:centromere protein s [Quercus suber]